MKVCIPIQRQQSLHGSWKAFLFGFFVLCQSREVEMEGCQPIDVESYKKRKAIEVDSDSEDEVAISHKKPRRRPLPQNNLDHMVAIPGQPDPMRLLIVVDPLSQILQEVATDIFKHCFWGRHLRSTLINLSLVDKEILQLTISQVSRRWEELLKAEDLWQWLFMRKWTTAETADKELRAKGLTWRDVYKAFKIHSIVDSLVAVMQRKEICDRTLKISQGLKIG